MRLIALALLLALPVQARTRSVHFPPERILWVAAHPDDESLIAPLLGKKCIDERSSCTILVLTRGEAGDCKLPGGCGDLGTMRAQEMLAAGAALHALVIQWSLPDVFNPQETWPPATAEHIAEVIAAQKPSLIYTFDPNHGSSCHPAHRYTAQLVLSVARNVRIQLVETEIIRSPGVSFAAATDSATALDMRSWWQWIVTDLQAHRSQFTPDEVREIGDLPDEQRRVWTMEAGALATAQYGFRCQ